MRLWHPWHICASFLQIVMRHYIFYWYPGLCKPLKCNHRYRQVFALWFYIYTRLGGSRKLFTACKHSQINDIVNFLCCLHNIHLPTKINYLTSLLLCMTASLWLSICSPYLKKADLTRTSLSNSCREMGLSNSCQLRSSAKCKKMNWLGSGMKKYSSNCWRMLSNVTYENMKNIKVSHFN